MLGRCYILFSVCVCGAGGAWSLTIAYNDPSLAAMYVCVGCCPRGGPRGARIGPPWLHEAFGAATQFFFWGGLLF
jgi:hypothetical protein